jgi:hypothetical protein
MSYALWALAVPVFAFIPVAGRLRHHTGVADRG